MKTSEPDIRRMLERRAAEFTMAPELPRELLRRGRRRRTKTIGLASIAAIAVAMLVPLSLTLAEGRSPAGQGLATGGRPGSSNPRVSGASSAPLKLVSYVLRDTAPKIEDPHEVTGEPITIEGVRQHAACMRSQGFDVPDPTEQPGGGWSTIIDDPVARGLDLNSPAFREAMFVTCGPLGGPLSGDMVIAGSRDEIDRFTSCMSGQGFTLPEPTKDVSGHYDMEEWQFDLTQTSIDTSTPQWNRAMFMTCFQRDG